jgi:hypothetical protein
MSLIINRNWFSINKFIDDNDLEKGIILVNEKNDDSYDLKQIKFITNSMSFIKKINNIGEFQSYLFHSSNEINSKLIDNKIIHVYFDKISVNNFNNCIYDDSKLIVINFDIYKINNCSLLNIQKSLSIFFTFENIKDSSFSVTKIKNILNIILKHEELIDLVHVSYNNFIKKFNDLK